MVRKSIFYFENAVYFASEILTLHLHFFCLFAIQSHWIVADYFLLLMKHQLNRMVKSVSITKKTRFCLLKNPNSSCSFLGMKDDLTWNVLHKSKKCAQQIRLIETTQISKISIVASHASQCGSFVIFLCHLHFT